MHDEKKTEHLKVVYSLIAVLFLIFIAYSSCLINDFVYWDTDQYLLKNLHIRSLNFNSLRSMFTSSILNEYTPLTSLSFAIEYHFFGYNASVYHFNNILLHMMVVALIFLFSLQCGLTKRASLLSALIFGIHPMHVESVAWVVERKDVLYSLFYMASLCLYMHYIQSGEKKYYLLALISGFFSILSKPMALSLPLLFFLCDWLKKRKPSYALLLEKIPVFFYVFFIALITFIQHARMPDIGNSSNAFLIWTWTFIFYIQRFLFPVVLIPLYSLPQPINFTNIHYVLSSLAFFVVLGLLLILRKKRWLVFASLFYFLSIFFLLRFDQGDVNIVADRFMYLPSLGFCMLLGLIFDSILDRQGKKSFIRKSIAVVLLIALFVFLSIKTIMQCRIWNNSLTFWEYVAKKNPGASTAYINLGTFYIDKGDYKKAIFFLSKAVSLNKNDLTGYSNLGTAYFHLRQFDQAEKYLKGTILIEPNYTPALNSLGLIYLEKGDYANAEKYFLDAIDKGPKFLEPRNNLAIVYEKQNKYLQAENLYRDNLALDPNHYQSLYSLLHLYMKENKKEKIIELGRNILRMNRDVEALLRLGSALAENNYSEIAIAFFTQAIQLDSQCKPAFVLLGNIYGNYQKFDKAIFFWREALKIDPQDASLRNQIKKVEGL